MEDDNVQVKKIIIEENLYYNKIILLNYRIEYPQFFSRKYQNNLNIINIYYKNKAYELHRSCVKQSFLEAIELYNYSIAKGYPIRQFEILSSYKITFNQDCAISLYFDKYEYMGGAHGITYRNSDTWDIKDGKRVYLCDLFSKEINYYTYIANIINNQIKLQQKFGDNYMYFEDFEKNVALKFNNNNFYLSINPKGIIIYFQKYDIAPYSMGIPEFIIPYNPDTMILPRCI